MAGRTRLRPPERRPGVPRRPPLRRAGRADRLLRDQPRRGLIVAAGVATWLLWVGLGPLAADEPSFYSAQPPATERTFGPPIDLIEIEPLDRAGRDRRVSDDRPTSADEPVQDGNSFSAMSLRDKDGRSVLLRVTGATGGSIWGTDVYTDDSSIPAAAVHGGLVAVGETAVVRLTHLPGQASYTGSTGNGVTTRPYGPYGGSFRLEPADGPATPRSPPPGAFARMVARLRSDLARSGGAGLSGAVASDPGTMSGYSDKIGKTFRFRVTGTVGGGSVWGTSLYTADSHLGTAAVHAGVLNPGQAGIVTVEMLPGLSSYSGTTAHGVTTSPWPAYGATYRLSGLQ